MKKQRKYILKDNCDFSEKCLVDRRYEFIISPVSSKTRSLNGCC